MMAPSHPGGSSTGAAADLLSSACSRTIPVPSMRSITPMNIRRLLTPMLLAACGLSPGITIAAEGTELAARVRAVLTTRCASCHGPELTRPKGRFGYVTDLKRLASTSKLVVPSNPEKSHLWQLVADGTMPPAESRTGALTAFEKELVHNWIAAGAPSEVPGPQQIVVASTAPAEDTAPSLSFAMRLLRWLGKFHILAIHFPIALLTAAAIAEVWCAWRRMREPWSPVRFCVLVGTAGALGAAALGWLHADAGGYGHSSLPLLTLHRWIGTTAAVWSLGIAVFSERDARHGRRSQAFRVALWNGSALIGMAAHFGGNLVHGEDFFIW